MDGDIKRRSVSRHKRPTQKSATLARKAALASHRIQAPVGKPLDKKHTSSETSLPKKEPAPRKHTERNIFMGLMSLVIFGLCMFALGYSLDHDKPVDETERNEMRANYKDLPRCNVKWVKDSASLRPVFELTFDRELPANFRTNFFVENLTTQEKQIIRPVSGRYTIETDKPGEFLITVMEDSDVATTEILCEYGPTLVGYNIIDGEAQP